MWVHQEEVWWKSMDFIQTILDLNPGSNTSQVPCTGLLCKLFTYIIGIIINISLIKAFGKLIFTHSSLFKTHIKL